MTGACRKAKNNYQHPGKETHLEITYQLIFIWTWKRSDKVYLGNYLITNHCAVIISYLIVTNYFVVSVLKIFKLMWLYIFLFDTI